MIYNQFLQILNKIDNCIILRGYEQLKTNFPIHPEEDVDILTENYNDVYDIIKEYLDHIDNKDVGHIIKLDDTLVKIDIRVVGDNYYDEKWYNDMLSKKILFDYDFYVMDAENYFYSILYHCLIHKNKIDSKYHELLSNYKINIDISDKQQCFLILEKFMNRNGYKFLKPVDINAGFFLNNYQRTKMLFIIRKMGLLRHNDIIDYVIDLLGASNYIILEKGLISIKDMEKMIVELYEDKLQDEEVYKSIEQANGNICYYIITDYNNYKRDTVEIKLNVIEKYPNPDNVHWNYFHSSDDIDDAYREIDILMNSEITSLAGVGTYYSQTEPYE